MNYTESLAYVYGAKERGAKKQGLTNMVELMKRLGNPEARFPSVHVAGTNGKGSVCAYLDSILRAADLRVGLYTSPYLERFTERIRLNGQEIPQENFASVAGEVRHAADGMQDDGLVPPTFFELTTACAFLYFAREGVDIAVIETGLGGRTDATNLLKSEVAVLTSIGIDHAHVLGGTLERIAAEKAGILKPGTAAVLAPGNDEIVRTVIENEATRLRISLFDGDSLRVQPLEDNLSGQRFSVFGENMGLTDMQTSLLGNHQLNNAATALLAAQALRTRGWNLSDDALRKGIAQARWPGRLELMGSSPAVLIDGAHNPQAAEALADAVTHYFPDQRILLVVAAMADKEIEPMAASFARFATEAIATVPPMTTARKLTEPDRLATLLASLGVSARACDDWEQALQDALSSGLTVVVAGSLYLAGVARSYCFAHGIAVRSSGKITS